MNKIIKNGKEYTVSSQEFIFTLVIGGDSDELASLMFKEACSDMSCMGGDDGYNS